MDSNPICPIYQTLLNVVLLRDMLAKRLAALVAPRVPEFQVPAPCLAAFGTCVEFMSESESVSNDAIRRHPVNHHPLIPFSIREMYW